MFKNALEQFISNCPPKHVITSINLLIYLRAQLKPYLLHCFVTYWPITPYYYAVQNISQCKVVLSFFPEKQSVHLKIPQTETQFSRIALLLKVMVTRGVLELTTAQKKKFSIIYFFSKCDQIRIFLRIQSHLLKKSLMENVIFCAVYSNIYNSAFLKNLVAKNSDWLIVV